MPADSPTPARPPTAAPLAPALSAPLSTAPPATRYQVRRITGRSAVRVGVATGWLLGLVPAMLIAWGVVSALGMVSAVVSGIKPMDISVLGATVATIDPIQILGQQDAVARLTALAASGGVLFVLLSLFFTLCFGVITVIGLVLFVGAYNLLANVVGGLEVDLGTVRP